MVDPCWAFMSMYECRLLQFSRDRSSVAGEPPVDSWQPAIQVNLASHIPVDVFRAQYYVCDFPGDPECYDPLHLDRNRGRRYGFNLCGQISLSMVLETLTNLTLPDLISGDANSFLRKCDRDLNRDGEIQDNERDVVNCGWPETTYGSTLQRLAIHVLPEDEGWHAIYSLWGNWWKSGSTSQERMQGEDILAARMKARLAQGHYLIPLVTLMPDASGMLVPIESADTTGHWVVLTGFSSPWDDTNENSFMNWVSINNPFYNRVEYYLWRDFRRSIRSASGGYGLLELWRD